MRVVLPAWCLHETPGDLGEGRERTVELVGPGQPDAVHVCVPVRQMPDVRKWPAESTAPQSRTESGPVVGEQGQP